MSKLFLLLTISITALFAGSSFNQCYDTNFKKICYKKFYDLNKIDKPDATKTYYQSTTGRIYTFSDNIEIRFKRIGAIIAIEDDFNIEFTDKEKKETYLYKLKSPHELFSIVTNLNNTEYISKAAPQRTRKLTIYEKKKIAEAKRKSMQNRLNSEEYYRQRKIVERQKQKEEETKAKSVNVLKGNKKNNQK